MSTITFLLAVPILLVLGAAVLFILGGLVHALLAHDSQPKDKI